MTFFWLIQCIEWVSQDEVQREVLISEIQDEKWDLQSVFKMSTVWV